MSKKNDEAAKRNRVVSPFGLSFQWGIFKPIQYRVTIGGQVWCPPLPTRTKNGAWEGRNNVGTAEKRRFLSLPLHGVRNRLPHGNHGNHGKPPMCAEATRHLPKNSFWPHIHHGRQLTQTHTHTPPPPLRWVRVCVVGRVGRAITAQKTPHHLLQKGSPNAVRMPSLCEHKKQRQTIRTSTASTTNQPNSH